MNTQSDLVGAIAISKSLKSESGVRGQCSNFKTPFAKLIIWFHVTSTTSTTSAPRIIWVSKLARDSLFAGVGDVDNYANIITREDGIAISDESVDGYSYWWAHLRKWQCANNREGDDTGGNNLLPNRLHETSAVCRLEGAI